MDRIKRFPVVNQIASQFLTLQSAIAHTDMPLATGPTCFMPFSQLFDKGYTAVKEQRYIDYFKANMVQLELRRGDAVFFNPATFHQPGVNVTDDERTANLLQVSSAFGRSMESCDRLGMTRAVWPVIKEWHKEVQSGSKKRTQEALDALIAATSTDYGYPKIIDLLTVSFFVGDVPTLTF
jgi:ectoine hydroxylase-related dioxygenase (phytanoyl-CoA dioxygenase family)